MSFKILCLTDDSSFLPYWCVGNLPDIEFDGKFAETAGIEPTSGRSDRLNGTSPGLHHSKPLFLAEISFKRETGVADMNFRYR